MKPKHSLYIVVLLFLIAAVIKVGNKSERFDQTAESILSQSNDFLASDLQSFITFANLRTALQQNQVHSDEINDLMNTLKSKPYTSYIIKGEEVIYWSKSDLIPIDLKKLLLQSSGYFKNKNDIYNFRKSKIYKSYKILLVQPIAGEAYTHSIPFKISDDKALEIKTIDDEVINLDMNSNFIVLSTILPNSIFLLALLLLLYVLPRLLQNPARKINPIYLCLFYFGLVIVSSIFFLIPDSHPTFWAMANTIIFSSLSFSLYHFKFKFDLKKYSSPIYIFIFYSAILSILILIYHLTKTLVSTKTIDIDYSQHFLFHQHLIGQLSILIILCLAASLICNKIMSLIQSFNLPFKQRIIPIFFALGFLSIVFILIYNNTNYILFLSLSAIMLMLLDLYQDRQSLNFTWLFTWVVLISAFLAINLTIHHIDSSLNLITSKLRTKIEAPYKDQVTQDFNSIILKDQQLKDYLSPPYPFDVNPKLISTRVKQLLPDHYEQDYTVDSYTFDNRGICISQNNPTINPDVLPILNRMDSLPKTTIDYEGNLHYIFSTQSEVVEHPYNPILSIFTITPNEQKNIDLQGGRVISSADNQLIYNSLDINRIITIDKKIDILPEQKGEYNLHQIASDSNIDILLANKKTNLLKPLSLFSLLITLTFIILLISTIINTYIKILPDQLKLFISKRKSLRYKIQLTVLSSIIGSFMIIAFITLIYLRNSYQHTNLQKVETVIESFLHQYNLSNVLTGITNGDAATITDLQNFSNIHSSQLQFFNAHGDLISDHPSHLIRKINPMALQALDNNPNNLAILTSQNQSFFDDLNQEAYLKVIDDNETIGTLRIASAHSVDSLSHGLSNFISTLLNVYVFLFLIAGTIAIALANSITRPIAVLGENLKNLKLGKRQEPLKWENQDELGDLIQDYNLTVGKLEESAKLLAITERESAWREMAKQVAHEIKNPLTPMKLSIQHLKMASGRAENPQIKSMIERVSDTLLEQIDALSDIASEFSNFAHFPKPENQTTVLNEVIATAHDLFRKRDDMKINLYVPIDEIYVFADKNYLLRVFNNLLKNAIQAIPNDRSGKIDIRLFKKNGLAIVEIEDNGSGIPKDMFDKVFTPNFTTKNSGTGLGLAISTNIIESFNGRIYFNTEENQGTTFFVEIPLMHKEDNFKTSNRVALD